MRAYTSLVGHILGSHPEIDGYYEMHRSYVLADDLDRQLAAIRRARRPQAGRPPAVRQAAAQRLHAEPGAARTRRRHAAPCAASARGDAAEHRRAVRAERPRRPLRRPGRRDRLLRRPPRSAGRVRRAASGPLPLLRCGHPARRHAAPVRRARTLAQARRAARRGLPQLLANRRRRRGRRLARARLRPHPARVATRRVRSRPCWRVHAAYRDCRAQLIAHAAESVLS